MALAPFGSYLVDRKLGFLQGKLGEEAVGVSALAMSCIWWTMDANSVHLVKECCELEGFYGTS